MPFRSAQADRWPKAFTPIEIGLSGRCAPGVGLRRRKDAFSVGAGRPLAEGFHADWKSASPGAARALGVGWPEASPIEIAGAARRASAFADAKDAFSVGAGRPLAEGLSRPNSFGAGRPPAEGLSGSNSFDS
jgi:hypothetical protein